MQIEPNSQKQQKILKVNKNTTSKEIILSSLTLVVVSVITSFTMFSACSDSNTAGALTASTTLKSSNLTTSVTTTSLEKNSADGSTRLRPAVSGLNNAKTPCPTGTTTCFSPVAMGGKFSSFNLRISSSGQYSRLELISQSTSDNSITSNALNSFDLGSPTAISGTPECCGDITFDSSSHFKDLIWNIGWIDAKFTDSSFGISGGGSTTLRFVYFTDSVTGYQKGDILIKDGNDFKWCPTTATAIGDCSTTRPGSPITQNSGIVNYTPESGSPVLPYLSAEIYESATGDGVVTTSASELTGSVSFTVDFDHENVFAVETPNKTFTNIFDVMDELYIRSLSATPTGVSTTGGLGAVLTVSK